MRVSAIVLAAGKGLRFKSRVPKPLVKINSKPVIIYSLLTLSRHPLVSEIILVVNPANTGAIIKKIKQYRIAKINSVVEGGKRRQDSVYCGLKKISAKSGLVLVHDGARPFVSREEVSLLITEARRTKAAILGVPVKQTIKESIRVSEYQSIRKITVKRTLDRKNLWEVQTPQVFARELILNAYQRFGRFNVTDDAALVERLGVKVAIVQGSYRNIKITTPEDLIAAEAILNNRLGLKRLRLRSPYRH
ncbi:MAG: 2-C-methyl-D-erythritol 4-phosphate cytidylyltransferase [Candidatus Omnitrophota bacterium]|nr:2-C-methyl-D-erythritol 4-phosphate cytidylyltransferase [Candidatus Omnitrophota bacterium]